jgi:hypothetical protein
MLKDRESQFFQDIAQSFKNSAKKLPFPIPNIGRKLHISCTQIIKKLRSAEINQIK